MELENVLDLGSVRGLFNPILPQGKKLWGCLIEDMIKWDWKRFTGISNAEYAMLTVGPARKKARTQAVSDWRSRMSETIQHRHDWIHNCGRPKSAIRTLSAGQAHARVREVRAVVEAVDDHLMMHRVV